MATAKATTTTKEAKAPNLYQRLLAVSAEVRNVEKKLSVSTGKSSYKAVADYDVVLAVKAAEAKFGIVGVPILQELVDSQVMEYKDSYGNARTQFVDIIKMTVRFYNVDDPAEFLDVTSFGRGIDPGDKSFGKASTYARKYALLNAYKIATGEDPDQEGSQEGTYRRSSATAPRRALKAAAPAAPTQEQAAAAEPEQPYIPMSDEDYQKVVTSYAMGRTTKSGGDIRAAWMAVTHAGKKELAAFDLEVARIRKAMAQAQAPADEL